MDAEFFAAVRDATSAWYAMTDFVIKLINALVVFCFSVGITVVIIAVILIVVGIVTSLKNGN